jgi:hypothetical protein
MSKAKRSALASLTAAERAGVLEALLRAHPRLTVEAERLAADLLEQDDRQAVAADVAHELLALHLGDLADRAGPQWGGGYVDPHEAAHELLAEAVQPYLDDLDWRARIGAREAATEIGLGLLLGLYSCRDEGDNDRLLTHAEMPDAIDNLGSRVRSVMRKIGLTIPEGWLAQECPDWLWWAGP